MPEITPEMVEAAAREMHDIALLLNEDPPVQEWDELRPARREGMLARADRVLRAALAAGQPAQSDITGIEPPPPGSTQCGFSGRWSHEMGQPAPSLQSVQISTGQPAQVGTVSETDAEAIRSAGPGSIIPAQPEGREVERRTFYALWQPTDRIDLRHEIHDAGLIDLEEDGVTLAQVLTLPGRAEHAGFQVVEVEIIVREPSR